MPRSEPSKSSESDKKQAKAEIISFDVWFARRIKSSKKLRPWYKEAVGIFMQKQGLKARDELNKFDAALEKF